MQVRREQWSCARIRLGPFLPFPQNARNQDNSPVKSNTKHDLSHIPEVILILALFLCVCKKWKNKTWWRILIPKAHYKHKQQEANSKACMFFWTLYAKSVRKASPFCLVFVWHPGWKLALLLKSIKGSLIGPGFLNPEQVQSHPLYKQNYFVWISTAEKNEMY